MNRKLLPRELTSYDLLKTFAVLLMLVDHIGYYFFEDENWWRVFGRLCVPVWFFLIGYARSRDFGPKLWIGAAILIAANIINGTGVFPFNILATMLIIRLAIDPIMMHARRTPEALWQMSVMLLLLTFMTSYLFEYGTLAIIMAMFGWLVRNQHEYPDGVTQARRFFLFALASFVILQTLFFAFKDNQITVLAVGILAVMSVLMFFRPVTFEGTGTGVKGVLTAPFRFIGRWTLEIYVAHLLIFQMIAAYTQPDRFDWFEWHWFPEAMMITTTVE